MSTHGQNDVVKSHSVNGALSTDSDMELPEPEMPSLEMTNLGETEMPSLERSVSY